MDQTEYGPSPLLKVYRQWSAFEFILERRPPPSTWYTTFEREENEQKRQMPICSQEAIPATVEPPNDP